MTRRDRKMRLPSTSWPLIGEAKRGKRRSSRAPEVRATTADRLPLIGAYPHASALAADRQSLERQAWSVSESDYAVDGIYVAGGFGSRGFTWGPWAAGILTAQIVGDPVPARIESLRAIVPNRQILRKLKRKLL